MQRIPGKKAQKLLKYDVNFVILAQPGQTTSLQKIKYGKLGPGVTVKPSSINRDRKGRVWRVLIVALLKMF